jgi:ribosomal protein L24E
MRVRNDGSVESWCVVKCELPLVAMSRCVVVVHFHHKQEVKGQVI